MKRLFLVLVLAAACGGTTEPPATTPSVSAGANTSAPLHAPITLAATFTDSASAAPCSYGIDWGDGQSTSGSKTGISPITDAHAYSSAGTYTVRVTVTNHRGAAGSGSLTATISADPVLLMAGDIGDCHRGGDDSTGAMLDPLPGLVVALGDNAYDDGSPDEYTNCYGPNWGRQKARTIPVAGNHDYNCAPRNPAAPPGCGTSAAGYFGYFGSAAGNPADGFYTMKLGTWFVVVVNTGWDSPDTVKATSRQLQWLESQLASHTEQCTVALFHHPRFSTIKDRPWLRPELKPLWDVLYRYGVDLVVNGHDHSYQRFAPSNPDGAVDNAFGIRQIVVGTGGGETLYDFGPTASNLEVRDNQTHGIMRLTLRAGGYDWQFLPVPGKTFTDAGSGTCHGRPS